MIGNFVGKKSADSVNVGNGDVIKFGIDSQNRYGYIEDGEVTVHPFADEPTEITYADWLLLTPEQQESGKWLVTGVPGGSSGGGDSKSVVGTVENGTTASQAYAVGEHFIRNDKFCTCIATIASGATLTLNTNYVEGTIADNLNVKDYSSHVTLNNNITWLSVNTNFTRIGNIVYFTVRGTFPASVSNGYNIFTLDQDVMVGETYNALLSSSWSNPQILGVLDCYSGGGHSRCEVAGKPSLGSKAFVCTGHFLIKN